MPDSPWPHAPPHWRFENGSYFITASTYQRERLFDSPEKLDVVTKLLIETAGRFGWQLRAWAIFSNHYHFLADSPQLGGESLRDWLREFHRSSAVQINRLGGTKGRRIWMNFRDTLITHQTSLLARLRYVNENPVKHGLVRLASEYRWCSAGWFEKSAPESFRKSVSRFKIDSVNIEDDFDP
jgi:putative transposase